MDTLDVILGISVFGAAMSVFATWQLTRALKTIDLVLCEVKSPDLSATIRDLDWDLACALDAARHLEAERDAARLQLHEAHAFIRLAITGVES